MPWTSKFSPPFTLRDGRTIATLADARALILALPELHQANAHWQYAAEMLIKAAEPGRTSMAEARMQMERALKAEGLLR